MVGNEEGKRYLCDISPRLCIFPKCWRVCEERTGFSKCCDPALASQSRSDDGGAKDQAAAKARAAAGLHDKGAGSEVSMARKADAASGAVLPDWLVHGLTEVGDNGPEVVDDRLGRRSDAEEGT